jgi:colicin import membrane protein
MSTVRNPQAPPPIADDADRFRYGWREVSVRNPDGTTSLEQLPLTREDALHPEPGDYIVHTDPHADDMVYFKSVFKALLKHDPSAAVLFDCGVDWGLRGIKHVCPDIAVLFNVDMKKWRRTEPIFYVKALHARTAFVIEVTSKSTRSNDLVTKVDYYHRCRVPVYIIVDAMIEERGQRKLKLIGYHYAPAGYERIAPNERGWIWLEAVGAWLGIVHDEVSGMDRVACFDAVSQAEIGDYTAITQAYAREVEAHARSKNRAAQAETDAAGAKAKAAKAEAKATKAEAKATKAEAKAAKAEAKAKAEAEARALAETRVRELEALLKRSTPGKT